MKQIISLFIIVLIIVSCSDFLDEDNKGGIINEKFYSTAVGYETLITASYNSLRNTYGTKKIVGKDDDPATYNSCPWLLVAGTDLYQKTRQNDHLSLYEYTSLFASDEYVLEFYTNCYKAIQTINTALYYIDTPTDLDESKRIQYKAEMRFLRAFYHFLLVEQFGGIPINKEITQSPRMDLPRNTLSECYEFIITEMEASVPDLSLSSVARVNQDVANHFLAKVYLTRGWDLGSSADFTTAKSKAQKVFDSRGNITLTFDQLWDPKNENNSEILFAIQYDAASIPGTSFGNTQQAMFGQYMGGSETNQKLMLTQLIPGWNLHNWYAENDNRYDVTFMLTVYENYFDFYDVADKSTLRIRAHHARRWGSAVSHQDSIDFVSSHNVMPSPFFLWFPFLSDEEAYHANLNKDFYTPTVKKFDSPVSRVYSSSSSTSSVRDIVLARLAETYFLYAEACIGLNDFVTAGNYVQMVLNRPGNAKTGTLTNSIASAPTQQEALHQYLIESGKEFVGEYNGRWPELRRTKMLGFMLNQYNYDVKKQVGLDFQNKYNLRPIPEDAITLNDGITPEDQNPGYQ